MKTITPEEKVVLAANVTTKSNGLAVHNEKNAERSGRNKLSLRPMKSLIRKSVRPMSFFAGGKKQTEHL